MFAILISALSSKRSQQGHASIVFQNNTTICSLLWECVCFSLLVAFSVWCVINAREIVPKLNSSHMGTRLSCCHYLFTLQMFGLYKLSCSIFLRLIKLFLYRVLWSDSRKKIYKRQELDTYIPIFHVTDLERRENNLDDSA